MKNLFYILSIICLTLSACIGDHTPDGTGERQIIIECALVAGGDPTARIHVSNSILDEEEAFFYPSGEEEAKIELNDIADTVVSRIAWVPAEGIFASYTTPILEGETYEINVSVPGKDVDPLYAVTTVPFAVPIESVEYVNPPLRLQAGDEVQWSFIAQVEIPEPTDPTTFYQLVPEVLNTELASQGIIQYDQLSKNQVKVLSEDSGINEFIHKNGIFIDNSRIDDNTVDLEIIFIVPVLNSSLLDSITFTLNTINREYMVYHENTDREIRVSSLPLDDPQISDTNIENGYGLFGAYSSSKITLPLE